MLLIDVFTAGGVVVAPGDVGAAAVVFDDDPAATGALVTDET